MEVSDVNDDCVEAADVGEGVLTLLLDVSFLSFILQDAMMMTYDSRESLKPAIRNC